MEVRKLCFRSSCQYTHGCCAPASWAARHTTVCLDYRDKMVVTYRDIGNYYRTALVCSKER